MASARRSTLRRSPRRAASRTTSLMEAAATRRAADSAEGLGHGRGRRPAAAGRGCGRAAVEEQHVAHRRRRCTSRCRRAVSPVELALAARVRPRCPRAPCAATPATWSPSLQAQLLRAALPRERLARPVLHESDLAALRGRGLGGRVISARSPSPPPAPLTSPSSSSAPSSRPPWRRSVAR